MNITLQNIGRRFNREWIFRGVDYTFENAGKYAVLGSNGSGKSTLLQVLNGSLGPSEGIIKYFDGGKEIEAGAIFNSLSLAAPYLEVIEDFSLNEMIDFHFKFKPFKAGMDNNAVADLLNLEGSRNKLIKYFSSGMKQRLKLALAFCADTPILMLDEPTSNLDTQGIDWYLNLIEKFSDGRLTIVCSNQEHEYSFCNKRLSVADYKPRPVGA
ncbi:ABC transporter ATP-binding protein [Mucilaginibacter phyllosphaerae]|uniref:ABC transporter ATP-binding protein n=1 Tax=Mucilaginibacter phyllosphaerae TaxID=1812349 RepID=A0A4Y8AEF1_9SPHI|nr:ATP-binding cassette domain-containing protein [Mucilaginibacter phyllosphaerae]MBB3970188.1 ABC-type multidrug transport system ATPase subunit [Mucilaginibacter phyllosphaerae]TEW66572.1 ABC transporter ATP-binding protein [Mucilaginibacter phyllosphaerae]GGH10408.1 ATP-binding protein [Mucilaginibacter phyllosphaerae]